MFHRADLLKGLFDSLPEAAKASIYTNKKVIAIDVNESGATVTCEDGSVFHGSFIIGADGVHSGLRSLIRTLALKESPTAAVNPEKPFKTAYQVMFGNITRLESLVPGETYETHGHGRSAQFFVGKERAWFFIYRKLREETDERSFYTEKDAEKYAEEMGDMHLTPDLTLREAFQRRNNTAVVNLEEGIVTHRTWKRVALVGDAAHKMTPNIGLGYNSAVEDLVVLVNLLHQHLSSHPEEGNIDAVELSKLLAAYQEERASRVKKAVHLSALLTRSGTWSTWTAYFLDRYLFPWIHASYWINKLIIFPFAASNPVLDWLPEKQLRVGRQPWANMPKLD